MKGRFTTALYAALLVLAASFGGATLGKDSLWHDQAARAATLFGPGMTPYAHVLVVAKSGGDYATITSALGSITDNSASSTYLIWVAPGVYSESNVTMKPYVDIQGAGEDVTKITSLGSVSPPYATLTGASNAEVRYLTIENIGQNRFAIAMYNSGTSPHLSHVTLNAYGGSTETVGLYNSDTAAPTTDAITVSALGAGINFGVLYYQCSNPVLSNATIVITSYPASLFSEAISASSTGSLTINNVNATINGTSPSAVGVDSADTTVYIQSSDIEALATGGNNFGIFAQSSSSSYTVRVDDSKIKGKTSTIFTDQHGAVYIGASHLSGGAVQAQGSSKCAGVYNENYTFFASTCP